MMGPLEMIVSSSDVPLKHQTTKQEGIKVTKGMIFFEEKS